MILTGEEWYTIAKACSDLSTLQYRAQGELTNIILRIHSIDDPYYMRLTPGTYAATLYYAKGAHQH